MAWAGPFPFVFINGSDKVTDTFLIKSAGDMELGSEAKALDDQIIRYQEQLDKIGRIWKG